MGLTVESTGMKSMDEGLVIEKKDPGDKVVALAGNPNVGKSTVLNGSAFWNAGSFVYFAVAEMARWDSDRSYTESNPK